MADRFDSVSFVRGVVGAVLGAVAGFFVFGWAFSQGFYAMMLPGAGAGFGAYLSMRRRSRAVAVVCAVIGLLAGLFTEWKNRPFAVDPSLGYFLAHVHHLRPFTLILIALGAGFAFWFGLGPSPRTEPAAPPPPDPPRGGLGEGLEQLQDRNAPR